MDLLGDRPFRMPDSWYDPPDDPPDLIDCPACGGSGSIADPGYGVGACESCEGTGQIEPPDPHDDPDPDRAYEEMRDRRLEEGL